MAYGYLIAGVLGLAVYPFVLGPIMSKKGLFGYFRPRSLKLPFREIFSFTLPLLSTDLVYLLRNFMVVAVLQYFYSTTEIAAYRAVLPVAGLNMLVYESFAFLFMPTAARMFARKEWSGINELYWQSATWIALVTFPIFVLTFSLAEPLTLLLFGVRYSQSGILLAVLAVGHFVNAALGFNAFTLRVYGKVRPIVIIDVVVVVASIAICFWLVPAYGAIGAAIAFSATMILHNVLNQTGLAMTTDIRFFEWHYLKTYLTILAGSVVLLAIQLWLNPPIYLSFVLVGGMSLLLVFVNRDVLNIAEIFPELLRLPILRNLIGGPKTSMRAEEQASLAE